MTVRDADTVDRGVRRGHRIIDRERMRNIGRDASLRISLGRRSNLIHQFRSLPAFFASSLCGYDVDAVRVSQRSNIAERHVVRL